MPSAKDIVVKPVTPKAANAIIKKTHYSGKVVNNSRLHFGVFIGGKLCGALQFGVSIDIRKTKGLVADTGWNEFMELNRMAFGPELPKFSESRAIGVCLRIIKKNYPHIKWIISFSDGTQCGDGTIYRASGFILTAIKKNNQILLMPDGSKVAKKSLDNPNNCSGGEFGSNIALRNGAKPLPGYQLRYIYFIDKTCKEKLAVPVLPFSKIDEMGAGMYKGVKRGKQAISGDQLESGGAAPTTTLHSSGSA